ncbi:MAG: SurA N-terminal domain-containing protein [Pseudomonadota bacterium]
MLQQLREYATGPVAFVLLGTIALSFVFFGIDFGAAGANVAMRVNGEEIPRQEVEALVRQNVNRIAQSSQGALTPELEQLVRSNSISLLVNQTLVEQAAERLGYRVGDAQVAEQIRSVPDFQIDGEFDRQLYVDALAANNRTASGFEAQVRQDIERRQILAALEQTSFVTTAEVQRRVALTNQTRTIDYFQIPAGALDEVEVADEEIQTRYEDFADVYTQAETVEVQYVELLLADVAQGIEMDEAELLEAYEADKELRYLTPEERSVSYILVEGTDERSPIEARELAADLVTQLDNGADFAELAAALSEDASIISGDLGWVLPDGLDPALSEAAFAADAGAVTGPVQTSFGWHVLKVNEVRGGDLTPFEEVREQILSQLQEERAEGLFIDRGDELAELVFQNAGSLEPAAEALALDLKTVAGVSEIAGAAVASNPDVRRAIFSPPVLEDGLNSDVIELEFGHLVAVRVIDRTPASLRPLEDVRDSIVSVLSAQKAQEATAALGEEIEARVRDGESLEAIAEELESVQAPALAVDITRRSRDVPSQLVTEVFAQPEPVEGSDPVVGGVALFGGNYAIYRLTGVKDGELSAEEGASLRAQLTREAASQEFEGFVQSLREQADIFVARDYQEGATP